MKKLVLVALALAATPLLFAAAPNPTPAVTDAALSLTLLDPPVLPATSEVGSSELVAVDLETLFTETANAICIDSLIPCSTAKDCVSVCQPFVCVCHTTCQICR